MRVTDEIERTFIIRFNATKILCPSYIYTTGSLLCYKYVRMVITYSKRSMNQPGKVVNLSRGQLNRENEYFPMAVRA